MSKVFRGKRIDTRIPISTFTIKKSVPPPHRPPAIVLDIPPRKWWWAEYFGPTKISIKCFTVLCYVSAQAERLALEAVENKWPQYKGMIRLCAFTSSTDWISATWIRGGFRRP